MVDKVFGHLQVQYSNEHYKKLGDLEKGAQGPEMQEAMSLWKEAPRIAAQDVRNTVQSRYGQIPRTDRVTVHTDLYIPLRILESLSSMHKESNHVS